MKVEMKEKNKVILASIGKEIDSLYPLWEEVVEEIKQENFCNGCDEISCFTDTEEYFGFPCNRESVVCPAEFNPEDGDCPYSEDYYEMSDKEEELRDKLNSLFREENRLLGIPEEEAEQLTRDC